MNQANIIDDFFNDKLNAGDIFTRVCEENIACRQNPAYIVIKVDYKGDTLSCSWYDYKKRPIVHKWTLYKSNLDGEYSKVEENWTKLIN